MEYWRGTGQSVLIESVHIRKDGSSFPVEIHARDVAYDDETCIIAIVRDITKRKKVEEELILLSTAVKTSVDAISVASVADGSLLFCNDAFLTQWKVRGDYHDLTYPECFDTDIDVLEEAVKATIAGGWTGELTAKTMDGQTFPIFVTTSPVADRDGLTIGMLGIFRDITERGKAIEE